jgi:hypothetical protein
MVCLVRGLPGCLRRIVGQRIELAQQQQQQQQQQSDIPRRQKPTPTPNERLVRCAACGTWMPASRAVRLHAGATYCSHSCLERAADSTQKARKSAS